MCIYIYLNVCLNVSGLSNTLEKVGHTKTITQKWKCLLVEAIYYDHSYNFSNAQETQNKDFSKISDEYSCSDDQPHIFPRYAFIKFLFIFSCKDKFIGALSRLLRI